MLNGSWRNDWCSMDLGEMTCAQWILEKWLVLNGSWRNDLCSMDLGEMTCAQWILEK